MHLLLLFLFCFILNCECHKILGILPSTGQSRHILYSSLLEELAERQHDVTMVTYENFPVKNLTNLNKISFRIKKGERAGVDVVELMQVLPYDAFKTYDKFLAFKSMAQANCRKIIENEEIRRLVNASSHFDVVIVEQFMTDCGLAIAHELGAPSIGISAHILLPWFYSRLGAPANPAFVPNHFFASGSAPDLFNRIKSVLIDFAANMYYRSVIQRNDQAIVNAVYPEVPDLEALGRNMSLMLVNQYYPLSGSRLYGDNVVEVGGMHIIEEKQTLAVDLQEFLDSAENGVVYISFGTVASNFPRTILKEIIKLTEMHDLAFVWKTDINDWEPPKNVYMTSWLPQIAILCHPKVKAFISHSGMLSTSEAMHCGVPIVSIPLFDDQFPNAQFAVEIGVGVTLNIHKIDSKTLTNAMLEVLEDKYQTRAKELSRIWRDRLMSPMDTAVFWIEYVARHKGAVNLRPPTVQLPTYQYWMVDIFIVITISLTMVWYSLKKVLFLCLRILGIFKKYIRIKTD